MHRLLNVRTGLRATIIATAIALLATGCSTYTLTPITATEAASDFPAGATYNISPPGAYLRDAGFWAIGFGQPGLQLIRWNLPDSPAVHEAPAGTRVKIEQYVRFDQHGMYDCGVNGWRFAIGHVVDGDLRGTRFLITSSDLMRGDEGCVLVPE